MAKADFSLPISVLSKALDVIGNNDQSREAQNILNQAAGIYHSYYAAATGHEPQDVNLDNIRSYPSDLGLILNFLEEQNAPKIKAPEIKFPSPKKEDAAIPADLETLVAQYKESQLEKFENDNSAHSVAETVKRARKTWEERNRVQTILKNRDQLQQEQDEKQSEKFFVKNVDPKLENKSAILSQAENLARQVVNKQAQNLGLNLTAAQKAQAVNDIVYLGQTGILDFKDLTSLSVVSQVAFHNLGATFDSPIIQIDEAVQKIYKAVADSPYSDLPDQEEEKLQEILQQEREKIEDSLQESRNNLEHKLVQDNIDYDLDTKAADESLSKIHTKLSAAIPKPRVLFQEATPLQKHLNVLENSLRQSNSTLRINPEGLGARAIATLQTTQGQNRQLSPEALRLYSLGTKPENIDQLEKFAATHPNTEIGRLYSAKSGVFEQVRYQLAQIHKSELGKEVRGGLKPLSGVSQALTSTYNKFPVPIQKASKFILDPKGTIYTWTNKKIGQYIGNQLIKDTNAVFARKLGSFLMNEGFKKGTEKLLSSAAGKALVQAGAKAGLTIAGEGLTGAIALALGIPTAGASLLIFAVVVIIQAAVSTTLDGIKKGINQIRKDFGIEGEFRWRDLFTPLFAVGGAAVVAGGTAVAGFFALSHATRIAFVSALSIILISLSIVYLYFTFAYLTAPLLSTLVQLDSVEKVIYPPPSSATSSGDCKWPTTGHYIIPTGPNGGTHRLSHLEGIDIAAPEGSSFLAVAPGTVVFTGPWGNFGNTAKIQSDTTSGGTVILYAHMNDISVSVGQKVSAGSVVGSVGGTGGWSPHIHFHYENIRYNSCPAGGLIIPDTCCNYCGDGSPICADAGGGFLYSN